MELRETLIAAAVCTSLAGCAATRPTVPPASGPVIGQLSGATYTAPDDRFSVRVPPVFLDWRGAESKLRWQGDASGARLHEDLRVEDGRNRLEGAEVDWVMFGPSAWHPDEIYHVVLAVPSPYRRYEDLDRRATEVIEGYLEQYDAQYDGNAERLVRKRLTTAGHDAVYAAYRYDFDTGSAFMPKHYRFYTSFCVFKVRDRRLATIMIEERPSPAASGGRNWDAWREHGYKTGGCWDDWIGTLQVNAPPHRPVAFK